MKGWTLLLLLLFALSHKIFSQQILWEKKFGWPGDDEFSDGVMVSPFNIIGFGKSRRFGLRIGNIGHQRLVGIKINIETGDTAWLKTYDMLSFDPKCIMGDNNLIYVVATESLSSNKIKLIMVDTSGAVFFQTSLDETGGLPIVQKLMKTNDGNFLLVGYRIGILGISNDMFALKFNALGQVLWNKRFNTNPNSGGNHVEETPEGNYLLSGNSGSRIWRVEVDSDGNQISSNLLYQTPSFVNFNERTSVKEHPFSTRVLSGNLNGSSSRFYFGYYQSNTNQKIWGGEQGGGIQKPYIHTDGTILQMRANFGYWFNKYNPDSTLNWSITYSGKFGAQNFFLNSAIYLPDSSAIFVGKIGYAFTSQADDFYFGRISNVGVPYDPSISVSTKSKIKGESLVPYPNPVSSSLVFRGLKQEGVLYVYDLKGQITKEMPIKPYQRVYLNDLSKGLYLYRIQTEKGFYSGKLVKE